LDKRKCPWSRSVYRNLYRVNNAPVAGPNGEGTSDPDELANANKFQSRTLDLGGDALGVADMPGNPYNSATADEVQSVTTFETCVYSVGGVPPCIHTRCCSRYVVSSLIMPQGTPGRTREGVRGYPRGTMVKEWCE